MTKRPIPAALRRRLLFEDMNHPLIVEARRLWAAVGWHPPKEDL